MSDNVTSLMSDDRRQRLRMLEAILFASAEPLGLKELAARLPANGPVSSSDPEGGEGALERSAEPDVESLVLELQAAYRARGVNLVRLAGKWAFRTAEDLAYLLQQEAVERRKLSRAAIETLAIIAYHQPVTRAEIEEIRGVSASKGTLDVLLETGWVGLKGRRKTPGKPVTYGTTPAFLVHFGLESVSDLPGLEELKQTGLLDLTPGQEDDPQGNLFDPLKGSAATSAEEDDETSEPVDDDDEQVPSNREIDEGV
ncbi:MAG: SMC-Scp complex subunit ScpB [Pseudomonadota bacterium]